MSTRANVHVMARMHFPRPHLVSLLLVLLLSTMAHGFPRIPPTTELRVTLITQTFMRHGAMSTNRSVTAILHSQSIAPEGASGQLDVPTSLGVSSPIPVPMFNVDPRSLPQEFDTVVYWGSRPTIAVGQPRVRKGRSTLGLRYLDGSTGLADPTRLASVDATASGKGPFHVRLPSIGDGTLVVSDAQDFLDPVHILAPANGLADFSRPIDIVWSPVPRAVGYSVTATARTGDGRTVLWENAWRTDAYERYGIEWAVRNSKLLPADQMSATIAPGIFMGGPVIVRVTAFSASATGKGVVGSTAWAQSSTSFELSGR